MNEFSALFYQGILTWLADRKKLRLQLLILPIVVPLLLLLFIVVTVAIMSTRIEAQNQGITDTQSIKVALTPGKYFEPISRVLSMRLGYEVIEVQSIDLKEAITSTAVLFGIRQETNEDKITLGIVFDRQRDYVNKKWIDNVKESVSDVSHAVHSAVFNLPIEPGNGLPRLAFTIEGYGSSPGISVAIAIMFVLFIVLVIYPIDISKSVLNQLFIEDITHGQLQLLNNAKVPPSSVILARWTSSLMIYAASLTVLLIYCFLFLSLYRQFAGFIASSADPSLLQKPELYPMVLGFNSFYDDITLLQLTGIWFGFIAIGAIVLTLLLFPAIKATSMEQARARAKLIDIIVLNIPIAAYILGAASPSSWLPYVPIINYYHFSLMSVNGHEIGFLYHFTSLLMIALLYTMALLVLKSSFYSDKRIASP